MGIQIDAKMLLFPKRLLSQAIAGKDVCAVTPSCLNRNIININNISFREASFNLFKAISV